MSARPGAFHLVPQLCAERPGRESRVQRGRAVLHVYVELAAAGQGTARRFSGVTADFAARGPCTENFHGLLAQRLGDISQPGMT